MAMAMTQGADLANETIVQLSQQVSVLKMKSIAVAHLGLTPEQVENIEYEKRSDAAGINSEILTNWAYRTRGIDQNRTLGGILYHEGVNPALVQRVLGVSKQEAIMPAGSSLQQLQALEPEDEDMQELIDEVKDFTEDVMKIEMAPWAAECAVEMEKLYTELTLEKLENKPTGPEGQIISDYKDLFTETEDDKPQRKRTKPKGKRILVKADPGFGKTTFSKKVAYDWATGVFHTVSIVFCIFLKLVRPGLNIENIIIDQYPPVEGLEIDEQRLKKMIQSFGNKCLIIFDGLDEIDMKQDDDVLKVIKGAKFSKCHVMLTSRPHSIANVVYYFPTVVRSQGFDKDRTKQFLSNSLLDQTLVPAVVRFTSEVFTEEGNLNSSPILLLFLSILVNDQEISFLREKMVLGDVYYRLVRSLYRKFCVRKELEFIEDGFMNIVKKVGKVAWDMLQSGDNWYIESEIVRLVGEEAFDTGLIIGSKGHGIMSKETADFIVSFPHRTIQEFLGSLFFILALADGENIEDLVKWDAMKCILTSNPMVLYFCVFIIKRLNISHEVYQQLIKHLSNQMNVGQLDWVDLIIQHPALDTEADDRIERELDVDVLGDLLALCNNTREVFLYVKHSLSDSYARIPDLNVVALSDNPIQIINRRFTPLLLELPPDELILTDNNNEQDADLDSIVKYCQHRNRKLAIYTWKREVNLDKFLTGTVKKVFIDRNVLYKSEVTVEDEIERCPELQHLKLKGASIDQIFVQYISNANQARYFPILNHMSFEDCGDAVKGKLHLLLDSEWPELTHLNLKGCHLDAKDIHELTVNMVDHENGKLPKLEALHIDATTSNLFQSPTPNMKYLYLYNVNDKFHKSFVPTQHNLPNLETLTLSGDGSEIGFPDLTEWNPFPPNLSHIALHRQRFLPFPQNIVSQIEKLDLSHTTGLTGNNFQLLSQPFPSLKSLVLSDCGLNSDDLTSLAEASVEGRLPKLTDLDVSENKVSDQLDFLFSRNCRWEKLQSFNMKDDLQSIKGLETVAERINSGCLEALENLNMSTYHQLNLFSYLRTPMLKVKHVDLSMENMHDHHEILQSVLSAVDHNFLPHLGTFILEVCSVIIGDDDRFYETDLFYVQYDLLHSIRDSLKEKVSEHLSSQDPVGRSSFEQTLKDIISAKLPDLDSASLDEICSAALSHVQEVTESGQVLETDVRWGLVVSFLSDLWGIDLNTEDGIESESESEFLEPPLCKELVHSLDPPVRDRLGSMFLNPDPHIVDSVSKEFSKVLINHLPELLTSDEEEGELFKPLYAALAPLVSFKVAKLFRITQADAEKLWRFILDGGDYTDQAVLSDDIFYRSFAADIKWKLRKHGVNIYCVQGPLSSRKLDLYKRMDGWDEMDYEWEEEDNGEEGRGSGSEISY